MLPVPMRVQGGPWDPRPHPIRGRALLSAPRRLGCGKCRGPGHGHKEPEQQQGRYLRVAPRPARTCGSPARGSAQSPPGRCPLCPPRPPRPPRRPPWRPPGGAHRQAGSCCSRAAPHPPGLGRWLGRGGPLRVHQRLWQARRPPGTAPGQRAPAAGSSCPPPRGSPGCPRTFLRRSRRSSVTSQDSTAHQGDPSSSRRAAAAQALPPSPAPAAAAAPGHPPTSC